MDLNERGFYYYHGDTIHYCESGANTKKSSKEMKKSMDNAWKKNKEYFIKKWGQPDDGWGPPSNPYKTPFDENNKSPNSAFNAVKSSLSIASATS